MYQSRLTVSGAMGTSSGNTSFDQEIGPATTPPLLHFPLNTTKLIQSPHLTDAIIDDSYSTKIVASPSDTIHADSLHKIFFTLDSYQFFNQLQHHWAGVM
jgi:hypothetical protein